MAPDDHDNQSGHPHPTENGSPAPLLNNPRATIYLDGLIYAAYNENKRVLESAICTTAENHHLVIEVKERGQTNPIWPQQPSDWSTKHTDVSAAAPFWLYVDSGNGIKEDEFNAELHRGDRTFNSVFDFEGHHGKSLPLKAGNFAVFNFPHGTSYSARTNQAMLKLIPANGTVAAAEDKGKIPVSNLAGIDIIAASNGAQKKSLVLANREKEFFRLELDPEKQYEINIVNGPANSTGAGDHEAHFLQFYELFDVDRRTLPRFLVIDPEHAHQPNGSPPVGSDEGGLGPPTPDNPPCAPGRSGGTGGLGSGG